MRLVSWQGRCLTSCLILILVMALTVCSCSEWVWNQVNPPGSNSPFSLSNGLGPGGPGAWDVVQTALDLEGQLSPPGALNDYNPFTNAQPLKDAITYWKTLCGYICAAAMPATYEYVHNEGGSTLQKCSPNYCNSMGFQCAMFVETVYHLAGHDLPRDDNAIDFYIKYQHVSGWKVLSSATNLPLPGDMLVWSGGELLGGYSQGTTNDPLEEKGIGHVAIVVDVQPPTPGAPDGTVTVAQANGPGNIPTPDANLSAWVNDHTPKGTWLYKMPLILNKDNTYTVRTWTTTNAEGYAYKVEGYVRNPALDRTNTPVGNLGRTPQWGTEAAAQYTSAFPRTTWQDSACSAAVMTEVINAYDAYFKLGKPTYKIADILKQETALGQITPSQGLLHPGVGMVLTLDQFGFITFWGGHDSTGGQDSANALSLDQIITIANSGIPVIVGLDHGNWEVGGHYMVVKGGDKNTVSVVDSSALNYTIVPRQKFMSWWSGLYVITYPANEPGFATDQPIHQLVHDPAGRSPASGMDTRLDGSEFDGRVAFGVWIQLAYFDALEAGIEPAYYMRQVFEESSYNANAPTTGPGDIGMVQASPSTIIGYNLSDPVQALIGAAKYDATNFHNYLGGNTSDVGKLDAYRKTFVTYNAGSGTLAGLVRAYGGNWFTHVECGPKSYTNGAINGLDHESC